VIERRSVFLLTIALGAACASQRPPPQPVFAEIPRGSPLSFQYQLADGKGVLTSQLLRGRSTVIAFVTTYDLASQAQARFLTGLMRKHPLIHVAAIVLEPPDNRPLIVAFRDALELEYPVALGDAALIGGHGPFGDVRSVPSTVVLDSEGRMVWRHFGLAKEEDVENALRGI
jgi:hypothetical protein